MDKGNGLRTKVKSRVSSRVVLAGVAVSILVGVSLIVSALMTPTGAGNFYSASSSDVTLTLPPPKPVCPAGNYITENKIVYKYECEAGNTMRTCDKIDDSYRCLDAAGNTNDDDCCLNKNEDAKDCPSGTTECPPDPNNNKVGGFCCNSQQHCVNNIIQDYCDNDACPSGKVRYTCGSARAACCNPEDSCGTKKIGVMGVGITVSVCVPPLPPGGCDGVDGKDCGTTKDDKKVCCPEGTKCKRDGDTRDVPVCVPQQCQGVEKLCEGDLGFALCCAGTCYRQGPDNDNNGLPDLPGCK